MKYNSEYFNQADEGNLPGHLGMKSLSVGDMESFAEMEVTPELLAINGFLHAGSIVTLADTTAGYGCMANLPEGASSFTTIELKCNFMGTAREGKIECIAKCIHAGKTTQVWDSNVTNPTTGRPVAAFRCTQMILYPKS